MMTRFQINEDNRTANAAQHGTELVSANQANATMESQMQTLLSQVHALQLANTHGNQTNNGEKIGHGLSCGRGRGLGRGASRGTE